MHRLERTNRSTEFHILLVEDSTINQKVAQLMLKDLASCGRDLILMDCLMPEIDGCEATRRIRATGPVGMRTPIIAMTANAFAKDREECLAAGMTDYLSKPVRQQELKAKLEQRLTKEYRQVASVAVQF